MKKWTLVLVSVCLIVTSGAIFLPAALAGLEWKSTMDLEIKETPLDVAPSGDGQWMYILTPGEILVYSFQEGKITDRVPVDKEYDRIVSMPRANALAISSSTKKNVRIITLENIYKIDISGLPVKGPRDAPVTIAVFDDYQ
ncbi:MAG TPA: hypothetical protein VMB77_08910 [Syntrophales bacterium]|nr:hypothetical protein [Syntrophales bacterium]